MQNHEKKIWNNVVGYRTATLFFSTFLFLNFKTDDLFLSHVIIIVALIISNVLVTFFYYKQIEETKIYIALLIEMIGIAFIISNTGFYYSFYYWMILNPLMIGFQQLTGVKKKSFVIFNGLLVIFMSFYTNDIVISERVTHAHAIFGLIVVFIFALILGKNLELLNITLASYEDANDKLKKSLNSNRVFAQDLIDATELIEHLSSTENFEQSVQALYQHLSKWDIGKSKFLYIRNDNGLEVLLNDKIDESNMANVFKAGLILSEEKIIVNSKLEGSQEEILITKCNYEKNALYFGVIVNLETNLFDYDYSQQLLYIRNQFNIQFSRIKLFDFKTQMMILQEQNRIAEEIHDQVNQQIFAASCLVYNIKDEIEQNDAELVKNQIDVLYEMLKGINKELKHIVFKMSLSKETNYSQDDKLTRYFGDLGTIYSIDINACIDKAFNDFDQKKQYNIFRIVNEAVANSVKHGSSNQISIQIKEIDDRAYIEVIDNGSGFDMNNLSSTRSGMGLKNMKKITQKYKGDLDITSTIGTGTVIKIVI